MSVLGTGLAGYTPRMDPTSDTARPTRLLLHACCGPCLLEPLDALAEQADEVTILFANPNIHPAEEYERRRDTLRTYATSRNIEVVELPYDPAIWNERVLPLANAGPARCRACYAVRLGQAAGYAAAHGFDALATTLTVSPYQDAAAIAQEGRRAAEGVGIRYVDRDFRGLYAEATRRSRELGMYRQNYCGCALSDQEAQLQRAERKAARQAEKAARAGGGES